MPSARATWCGWASSSSAPPGPRPRPAAPPAPIGGWRTGFTTNVADPKTVLFFLSLLPPFAHGRAELVALAAVTVAYGAAWWTLVILGVERLAGWLERPEVARRVDGVTGGALFVMAAFVLTSA